MADCIDPGTFREEDLAAYALDPAGDASLGEHIAQCPACAALVAEMRGLSAHLGRRLARSDCPTTDELDAYLAQELAAPRQAEVEQHIQECSRCAAEVALSQEFFAQEERLLAWQSPARPSIARRLVAALQSATGSAATPSFALRGTTNANNTPQIYTIEDVMLTLRYLTGQQARAAQGQLQGIISVAENFEAVMAPIPVRLLSFASEAATPELFAETTAEMGLFAFAPVPAGSYQLEVALPERLIVVETVTLS